MTGIPEDDVLADEFAVPEGVRPVVDRVLTFIEGEVLPYEEEHAEHVGGPLEYLDEDGRMTPEARALRDEIQERAGEAGIYALHMPEEVGGGGLSPLEHFYVQEAVFRHGTGFGSSLARAVMAWTEGPSPALLHLDEGQRGEWLDPLIDGTESACICITEPNAGSDVTAIETEAKKDGDEWVIDGHKRYITNAVYADTAQVLARTDRADGTEGMAMFLVDTENPGYEVGRMNENIMMDGITADVHLEDCRVGDDQMVGGIGDGLPLALSWVNWRRACRPGMCVGMGRYLLDRMLSYAKERETFGEPIGSNQAIQWPIADTATEIHAVRNMATTMLAEYEGMADLADLRQPEAARRRLSMLKYYPEDRLFDWSDRAIQVLGGYGLMRAGGVERVFRVARNLRIPAGTTEVQKRTIARTLGLE
ncbi:acyl-CoA dehydrogenase family protein [Halorarum salinum]|uniref:Medium-chain specific acyl-CoA dehydrogenase, mitochondrial n=1 Tax=Halorarum salinum TaxID=2743089 RepID=A0A7D5QC05_9EURY|nr:acyl-CoA dehydrogenase family protein [Halobaculum salinum]QLG63437.1 acyl-CoA dehydrogenase family protein [Halobaculum salinum]